MTGRYRGVDFSWGAVPNAFEYGFEISGASYDGEYPLPGSTTSISVTPTEPGRVCIEQLMAGTENNVWQQAPSLEAACHERGGSMAGVWILLHRSGWN